MQFPPSCKILHSDPRMSGTQGPSKLNCRSRVSLGMTYICLPTVERICRSALVKVWWALCLICRSVRNPLSVTERVAGMAGGRQLITHVRGRLTVNYARTTLAAWKPLGPFSKSNSTVSPSFRVR